MTASKIISFNINFDNKMNRDLMEYLKQPNKKCFNYKRYNFIYEKNTKINLKWNVSVTYLYCYYCSVTKN